MGISIAVINRSTVITGQQAWNLAWALDHQAKYQFGRVWGIDGITVALAPGTLLTPGTWPLYLLDSSDQQGALGYHDEEGNELPYGRVFAKTTQEAGAAISEVASHELCEMLADPHVNQTAYDPKSGRLYAYEVGDPCQSTGYDVGAPDGHKTGVTIANFVRPNWFDPNTPASAVTDYRGTLKGPFALGAGGYVSFTTSLPPAWEQQLGAGRPSVGIKGDGSDHDERLVRRGVLSRIA